MKRQVRILVVDDEPTVRESIKRLLEHDGHEVQMTDDGEAALALLSEQKFDLVFTDFLMPGMHGDQLVVRIRKLWPAMPIIMATAFPEEFKVFGQKTGSPNALLLKPFTFDALRVAIDRVLTHEQAG